MNEKVSFAQLCKPHTTYMDRVTTYPKTLSDRLGNGNWEIWEIWESGKSEILANPIFWEIWDLWSTIHDNLEDVCRIFRQILVNIQGSRHTFEMIFWETWMLLLSMWIFALGNPRKIPRNNEIIARIPRAYKRITKKWKSNPVWYHVSSLDSKGIFHAPFAKGMCSILSENIDTPFVKLFFE